MNEKNLENVKFVTTNSNFGKNRESVFVPIGLAIFTQLKFGKLPEFSDLYDKISYTKDENYKNLEMQTLDIAGKYILPEVNPKTGEPTNGIEIFTDLCQIKIYEILIRLKEVVDEKNCNIVLYDLNMWKDSSEPEIIHCELKYFIDENGLTEDNENETKSAWKPCRKTYPDLF